MSAPMNDRYARLDTDLRELADETEILAEALRSPVADDSDAILRCYIKTKSVSKTVSAVWDAEIKQDGDKQYAQKDVSSIIKLAGKTGNPLLDAIGEKAKTIFSENAFRHKATGAHN